MTSEFHSRGKKLCATFDFETAAVVYDRPSRVQSKNNKIRLRNILEYCSSLTHWLSTGHRRIVLGFSKGRSNVPAPTTSKTVGEEHIGDGPVLPLEKANENPSIFLECSFCSSLEVGSAKWWQAGI